MGVYIKGMEIPKEGAYLCELGVLDGNTAVLTIRTPVGESQRSYKLIPVPPHGRLIDADALAETHRKQAYKKGSSDYGFHITARAWVNDAPTIIPAEEET